MIRDAFLKVINSTKKKNVLYESLQFFFEQPVADILVAEDDKQKEVGNMDLFKKRLIMVKRLWSII